MYSAGRPSRWASSAYILVCYCFMGYINALTYFIIRLEARLQPYVAFSLERARTVFTRSNIIPPKVNRIGRHLEHSEYIVWGWLR